MAQKIMIFGGSGAISTATARLHHGAGNDLHLASHNTEGLRNMADDLAITTTIGDVTHPALFKEMAMTQGFAFHPSIGMAKGAIEGLTHSLAAQLAPKIQINTIAHQLTETPLATKVLHNQKLTRP